MPPKPGFVSALSVGEGLGGDEKWGMSSRAVQKSVIAWW